MYAYSGVLTALLRRALTGEVSSVEVSLFEALGEWMGSPAYYTQYGGRQPSRMGMEHATIAPYGPFLTADGTVLLAVQNDREWAALCGVLLGDPGLATEPRFAVNSARVANRAEVNRLVGEQLSGLTSEAAMALLDKAGIAVARINEVADFLSHPVLAERERWREVAVPGGTAAALLPPVDLAGVDPVMGAVPAVGEHTDLILRELGRGGAEIEELRRQAIV
jgi:formyl-CoA transferase